jgi:hypothetical protein
MLEEGIFSGLISVSRGFFHSGFFGFIRFILGVYVLVLLADIIMLLILRGVGGNIRTTFRGLDIPSLSKKKWQKITSRIHQDNPSQYKVAILEADKIVDDILKGMGYKGENMIERLDHPTAIHIENAEDLKKAHQVRNQIIHETNYQIDRKKAEEIIGIYENFLRQSEFLG